MVSFFVIRIKEASLKNFYFLLLKFLNDLITEEDELLLLKQEFLEVAFVVIEHIGNNSIVKNNPVMEEIQPCHVTAYFEIKHSHEADSPYY